MSLIQTFPSGNNPGVVSKTADGLAPQLPNETTTTKYLRQDGTWEIPPNTYDRNRYQAAVKAWSTSALAGNNIIVGINGEYHQLNAGIAFDITYPILFLSSTCNADAITYNSYNIMNITITTTQAITLTPYIPVFIKGTLSGAIFTPVSTTPLTQTIPTTDDGYQYIFLGNATSSVLLYLTEVHNIYEYKNGVFGPIIGAAVINGTANLLAASWVGESAPYTQTVNVAGILTSDNPIIDISVSDTVETGLLEIADWAKISKATAGAGSITFSCYEEKPTNDLVVNIKVVR